MSKQTYISVEIGGVRFETPYQFTDDYSAILNEWYGKGPITGRAGERVGALLDVHPERLAKLKGSRAVAFISGDKDKGYKPGKTFRVVLETGETVSFGISTVRYHFWPKKVRAA